YPDGRVVWRARYSDPASGPKRQNEKQFHTRKEAERWLTAQRAALQRGEHIDPRDSRQRFGELIEEWRASTVDLRPSTRSGYESIVRVHIAPRWGSVQISAISAGAIQEWVNELAEGRHPRTVRRIYGVLRVILKF